MPSCHAAAGAAGSSCRLGSGTPCCSACACAHPRLGRARTGRRALAFAACCRGLVALAGTTGGAGCRRHLSLRFLPLGGLTNVDSRCVDMQGVPCFCAGSVPQPNPGSGRFQPALASLSLGCARRHRPACLAGMEFVVRAGCAGGARRQRPHQRARRAVRRRSGRRQHAQHAGPDRAGACQQPCCMRSPAFHLGERRTQPSQSRRFTQSQHTPTGVGHLPQDARRPPQPGPPPPDAPPTLQGPPDFNETFSDGLGEVDGQHGTFLDNLLGVGGTGPSLVRAGSRDGRMGAPAALRRRAAQCQQLWGTSCAAAARA